MAQIQISLSWDPPTTRADGTDLDAIEIASYWLDWSSSDGAASGRIVVPGDQISTQFFIDLEPVDVNPGLVTLNISVTAVDADGRESTPSEVKSGPFLLRPPEPAIIAEPSSVSNITGRIICSDDCILVNGEDEIVAEISIPGYVISVTGSPDTPVAGTAYYVDYEAGLDSNAGTNSSVPFKHHPWDGQATSTAAATTLSAGDGVLLKRGTIYEADNAATGTMFGNADVSANTTNPMLAFGAYGAGDKPIVVGGKPLDETQFSLYSGSVGANTAVWRAALADIGLTGVSTTYMHFFEADMWDSFEQPLAEFYANNGSIPDANKEFYYDSAGGFLYLRMHDGGDIAGKDIYASWMKEFMSINSYGYSFSDLTFYGAHWYTFNIFGSASSGYGAVFDNVDMGWARYGINVTNAAIHVKNGCNFRYFFDLPHSDGRGVSAGGNSGTLGSLVEDSTFIRFENSTVFFTDNVAAVFVVRRCFFMDSVDDDASFLDPGEHCIQAPRIAGGQTQIYRNVFFNSGNDCWFDAGFDQGSVDAWNNTIVETRPRFIDKSGIDPGYSVDYTLDCRNNVCCGRPLVSDANSTSLVRPDYSTMKLNYNYYVRYSATQEIARTHHPVTNAQSDFQDLGLWQTWLEDETLAPAGGKEENSAIETTWANLTDVFESITYGDANFLRPKAAGPLIGAGETITNETNEYDKDGDLVTGSYDIGAYQGST